MGRCVRTNGIKWKDRAPLPNDEHTEGAKLRTATDNMAESNRQGYNKLLSGADSSIKGEQIGHCYQRGYKTQNPHWKTSGGNCILSWHRLTLPGHLTQYHQRWQA
ncbi:MAG: hypothetical protein RIQ78_900 [Bacteroidota bacterium]